MPETLSKKPIETATAMSLEIPEHRDPVEARSDLLDKLLKLALDKGDVRAAKLYLDYSAKFNISTEESLSLEKAIKLLQESSTAETEEIGDDDDLN